MGPNTEINGCGGVLSSGILSSPTSDARLCNRLAKAIPKARIPRSAMGSADPHDVKHFEFLVLDVAQTGLSWPKVYFRYNDGAALL
jgi:hypothetical protein